MSNSPSLNSWPRLASPYAQALRDAVAFVTDTVEPLGVVATGTIVRGTPDASSDLDLFVIHDAPFRRRVQKLFHGVPTEIFINPPATVRRCFAEEHRDGRPITAHMLATGHVVLDTHPVVTELRREAAEWLASTTPLTDGQAVPARYAAASRLEDATDVADTDPESATMMLTQAVIAMLEHHCRVTTGRVPRGKDLLGTVDASNAELGRLAHTFFSAPACRDRQAAAEAIADRTIGARGFFEWDSGPEAVRPTSDDDRKAIDAVRDAWVAAIGSGDARPLAELVTADYEVWAHGAPPLGGPQTVVAMMGAALTRYTITQQYDPIETIVSGDWAFQRGIERIRAVPRGGGPAQENAQRALLVLKRGDDGKWRYARGMTNGLPATTNTDDR